VNAWWVGPVCETLHGIGITVFVGIVAVLNLRALGVARPLPLAPLRRLLPWAAGAFLLQLVTGLVIMSRDLPVYVHNVAFWMKMLCLVLVGLAAGLSRVTGLSRAEEAVGAGEDAPAASKARAIISLLLWVGVLYWGRMMQFFNTAF